MLFAHFRRLKFSAAVLSMLVLLVAGGCCCFTTPYDMGVYATWDKLEHGLNAQPPAATKLAPTAPTLEEQTGVTIRLPLLFNYKEVGLPLTRGAARGGKAVEAERIQPPGLDLPGYYITYEMFYPDDKGQMLPVYCYLGALPKGQSKEAKQAILNQLKDKHPGAEWADKTLKNPSGEGNLELVPSLSISGQQSFYPKGQTKAIETPGQTDIYVVPRDHATVIVAWRAPQAIARRISFFEAAQASVASIKSEKPGAPIEQIAPGGATTGGAASGNYVQVPGSTYELVAPPGYTPSQQGSDVLVNYTLDPGDTDKSLPSIRYGVESVPFSNFGRGMTAGASMGNNTFVSREEVTIDGQPAFLVYVNTAKGRSYWGLYMTDGQQTSHLTASLFDPNDQAEKESLRRALLTARKQQGAAAGAHVQAPGTDVELIPPPAFSADASISGFEKVGPSETRITVNQQPNPYSTLIAGYTDAYFSGNNLKVVSREDVTAAGGGPAVLWLIEQQAGAQYWLYVFGDDQQSYILNGILAEKDDATKQAVRDTMLTARKRK